MKIRTTLAIGAVGAALLLGACSSSSKSSSTTTTAKSSSSTTAGGSSTTAKTGTLPTVAGLTKTGTKTLSDNGTMTSYTASGTAATIVSSYDTALKGAGYSIASSGSGGAGRWGGGGLTATASGTYVVVSVGGSTSTLYVDVCQWPSKPSNDDCGDNDNQDKQNQNQQQQNN